MGATAASPTRRVAKVICPHDCPDTCVMTVTVENGRAIAIGGDPDHRFTQGFLCAKVNQYLDRMYSPDRILFPLRRAGKKGEGRFERIGWADALDEIASRFKDAISRFGAQAILPYSYAGNMGLLSYGSMDRRTRKGCVVGLSIWWAKMAPGGRNANAVTSQELTDMGGGATFYDCLVEVAPA